MICIECMKDKSQSEWAIVYHIINEEILMSIRENPDSNQGDYCICKICIDKNEQYPSLKSIN
jgi:hypothetical protein